MKHVYEFTNKRKLTKAEFLKWFQKKFLYTIRKFEMVKKNDVLGYKKSNNLYLLFSIRVSALTSSHVLEYLKVYLRVPLPFICIKSVGEKIGRIRQRFRIS